MRTKEIDVFVNPKEIENENRLFGEYFTNVSDTRLYLKAKLVIELPEISKGFTESEVIDRLITKFSKYDIDCILNSLFKDGE